MGRANGIKSKTAFVEFFMENLKIYKYSKSLIDPSYKIKSRYLSKFVIFSTIPKLSPHSTTAVQTNEKRGLSVGKLPPVLAAHQGQLNETTQPSSVCGRLGGCKAFGPRFKTYYLIHHSFSE